MLGDHQDKLWDITKEALSKIVPADKFAPTEEKINSFKSGYGTVLFFEDSKVVSLFKNNLLFIKIISEFGLNKQVECTNLLFGLH